MFTKSAPPIPLESPLAPYAHYMIGIINDVWLISIIRIAADVIMLAILLTFLYWVFKLGKRVEENMVNASEDRKLSGDILKIIKGWTVLTVSTDRKKMDDIKEVKQSISEVPELTAHKVIEKIEEKKSSESGVTLKTVNVPESGSVQIGNKIDPSPPK